MQVCIAESAEQLASVAADAVSALFADRPEAVLGVATGSSPVGVYDELGRRCERGELSLARARIFMLDEYLGLPSDHPQRYRNVIQRDFVDKVDVDPSRVHGPHGTAEHGTEAGAAYEEAIVQAGGIDLQILGIGSDGHIAFNEPGSSLASRTRIKTLTRQTREDNARFFGDDVEAVPRHCLTQGIGTVLDARHLLLVASGHTKAEAVHQLVEGPVSALWPATALQLHPHVSVVVDAAGASRLQLADYYREAWAHKPSSRGM